MTLFMSCMYFISSILIMYSLHGETDIDWSDAFDGDKQQLLRVFAFSLAVIFSPITLFAFAIGYAFQKANRLTDKRISEIMKKWEDAAADKTSVPRHHLVLEINKELYYEYMREAARNLSDSDLSFLAEFDRTDKKFNQEVINMVIDETFERTVLRSKK